MQTRATPESAETQNSSNPMIGQLRYINQPRAKLLNVILNAKICPATVCRVLQLSFLIRRSPTTKTTRTVLPLALNGTCEATPEPSTLFQRPSKRAIPKIVQAPDEVRGANIGIPTFLISASKQSILRFAYVAISTGCDWTQCTGKA